MAKSQSDTLPEVTTTSAGKTLYRYNIQTVQITDPMSGKTRTAYAYDEVRLDAPLTKAKVLAAMKAADAESDAGNVAEAAAQHTESKAAIALSEIANLSYAQLSTYIENNVTTLATSKAFLKKLANVVLALVKAAG